MSSRFSLTGSSLRYRDLFGAFVIFFIVGYGICRNAREAAAHFAGSETRRLRICAVAARHIAPGAIVQKEDIVIRVRPAPTDEYYNDATPLVGRQVNAVLGEGDVITEATLVSLDVRRKPVTFFISVDGTRAGCIANKMKVTLVQQGKESKSPTLPVFTVVDVRLAEKADEKSGKKPALRLQLRADHGEDAMRVLAMGDGVTFVPLLLDGSLSACPPDVPAKQNNKRRR